LVAILNILAARGIEKPNWSASILSRAKSTHALSCRALKHDGAAVVLSGKGD